MSNVLKQKIISFIPLYISKECPAFNELKKAIEDIPDDKFTQIINQQSLSVGQRIHYLLDEIIFFLNQHYPINQEEGLQLDQFLNEIKRISMDLIHNNQQMINEISNLKNRVEILENDKNEIKKRRTTAEILAPIVKEIRTAMINQNIPDRYYSKTMINSCLLRTQGQNISWEISDFNRDNPQSIFDFDIFHRFESIIKHHADVLRINYNTLLELLYIKLDRNEIEHESIKNFLRYHSADNASFNAFLSSMGMIDVFNVNEKLCLEMLYRNYFLSHYYSIE